MSLRRRIAWSAGLLILAAGAATGLFGVRNMRRAQAAKSIPTAPVRKGDFAELVRCRGELAARRSLQLSAPMNIPDLKIVWMVEPGAHVKAADVVIKFDASGAKRQLDEQSAALRQSTASLDQALAQARTTAEQDKLDLANAKYEVERAKLEASKQAIVSVIQGESSKIDLATAQAKLRVQEATTEMHSKSDEAKIASMRRQKDKAQADVDLTKHRIEQTNLKAPIEGLVTFATNYSQGWMNAQPFKVGDQVWQGAVVAEIPDMATMQMEAKIEEVDRGRVSASNEVRIHIDALPERTFNGKLDTISQLTRTTFEWPPSRVFMGEAPVEKPDARLRPGMNGSADIVVRHLPGALSVPAKAVFTRGGKPVVYVSEPKGFRTVLVEVLARNPDEVAVNGIGAGSSVALAEPEQEKEGGKP